jgi:putative NIF3 family GTP cyclohydrolase 1 type 2
MLARNVMTWLEQREPQTGKEEGFKFGDPEAQVTGVLVCWMPTVAALKQAIAENCNLIICHETLFFPHSVPIDQERCWHTNRRRSELMSEGNLVVYRAHGKLDRLCIVEDLFAALDMRDVYAGEGLTCVFAIPPMSVRTLADRAKRVMGLPRVRTVGNLDQVVQRVGLPLGGAGLESNIEVTQRLIENGADVLVAGETEEFTMRFAEDVAIPLIETSHAASENIGLRHFGTMLAEAFADLNVVFHDGGSGWQVM